MIGLESLFKGPAVPLPGLSKTEPIESCHLASRAACESQIGPSCWISPMRCARSISPVPGTCLLQVARRTGPRHVLPAAHRAHPRHMLLDVLSQSRVHTAIWARWGHMLPWCSGPVQDTGCPWHCAELALHAGTGVHAWSIVRTDTAPFIWPVGPDEFNISLSSLYFPNYFLSALDQLF